MKLKSIQVKIALWGGVCLLITAAIIVVFSAVTMRGTATAVRENALSTAEELAVAVAKDRAAFTRAELEVAMDAARGLAQTLSGVRNDLVNLTLDREEVNAILRILLEENPQFVGTYTCWEPNAFDGRDAEFAGSERHDETGRYIPYWCRNAAGEVTYEPLLDYEVEGIGDYYQVPKKTKTECIIDPYVYPVQGTDTLITSLVVPIVVNDVFYGIAGVDLRLDFLQELADDVSHLYDGKAQVSVISNKGTLAAVTNRLDLQGKHLKELRENWEKGFEYITKGEAIVRQEKGN